MMNEIEWEVGLLGGGGGGGWGSKNKINDRADGGEGEMETTVWIFEHTKIGTIFV